MKCTCQRDSACSSCRPSLVERQEELVRELQTYLIGRVGNTPSGQFKDYAIALGVAVDKLVQLRPRTSHPGWFNQQYGGSINRSIAAPRPEDAQP